MKASMGCLGFIRVLVCRGCFVVIYYRNLLVAYRAIKEKELALSPLSPEAFRGGRRPTIEETRGLLSCFLLC